MKDYTIGILDNRQLRIRTYTPCEFNSWRGGSWQYRSSLLLNPIRWMRAIKNRYNWDFWLRRCVDITHRCYCPTGNIIDGRIVVCGFGMTFWYSRFTGTIPCACDEMMAAMYDEERND